MCCTQQFLDTETIIHTNAHLWARMTRLLRCTHIDIQVTEEHILHTTGYYHSLFLKWGIKASTHMRSTVLYYFASLL